jgi:hypothetical protein
VDRNYYTYDEISYDFCTTKRWAVRMIPRCAINGLVCASYRNRTFCVVREAALIVHSMAWKRMTMEHKLFNFLQKNNGMKICNRKRKFSGTKTKLFSAEAETEECFLTERVWKQKFYFRLIWNFCFTLALHVLFC